MSLLDHDLDYFLAIAAHRSLARAATAIGVSQPTLSRAVQKLEQRVGASLLERTNTGVSLTPSGRQLAQRAQVARVALDDASREIRDAHDGKGGRARVAAGSTLWPIVSRALIPTLNQQRPVAVLELNVMLVEKMVEQMQAGLHDFGVCVVPNDLPGDLEAEILLHDVLVPIVRVNHPLTRGPVSAEQLLEQSWISVHSRVVTHNAMVSKFHYLGLPAPRYAVMTDSMEIALRAVEQSDFVAFAPRWRTQAPVGFVKLVPLEIQGLSYTRSVGLLTRQHAYRGPIAERARALVRDSFKALSVAGGADQDLDC